jgi:hypothetical protein
MASASAAAGRTVRPRIEGEMKIRLFKRRTRSVHGSRVCRVVSPESVTLPCVGPAVALVGPRDRTAPAVPACLAHIPAALELAAGVDVHDTPELVTLRPDVDGPAVSERFADWYAGTEHSGGLS